MLEIAFLVGFLLHNLEEYVWLPTWSEDAKIFHPRVTRSQFGVLVSIVSIFGIVITCLFLNWEKEIIAYAYYAFVLIMVFNVVFPHLIATVWQRRYAPGLATALVFNLPLGIIILYHGLLIGMNIQMLLISIVGVAGACGIVILFLNKKA